MQLSNENGNGHGEYQPEVIYRYLDVDVWIKTDKLTGAETVAYTDDLLSDLYGEDDSDDLTPDNNNN
jgi:hypothetical protein